MIRAAELILGLVLLAGTPVRGDSEAPAAPDQSTEYAFTQWRPLTALDWAASANEALGIRHAVILYEGTMIDDRRALQPSTVFSRYTKLRIVDEQGAEENRTVSIPFPEDGRIFHLEARTVKPDGRTFPVAEERVREEGLRRRGRGLWRSRVLTFEKVQSGDIVEFFYSMTTPWEGVPPVALRHPLYTVTAELIWWFYTVPPPKVSEGVDERQTAFIPAYTLTAARDLDARVELLPAPDRARRLRVSVQNVPPVAEEPYRPSGDEIASSFLCWYDYPGQDRLKPYWLRLAEEWGEQSRDFLKADSRLEEWMAPILAAPRDTAADVERCFRAVHGLLRNVDYAPGAEGARETSGSKSVDDLLAARKGTSLDLNRLFVGMMRRLRYPATVFWIRDREQGNFVRRWENPDQLSMSGVCLRRGAGFSWLFPAIPLATPADTPWQADDCEGVLEQISPSEETMHFPAEATLPMGTVEGNSADLRLSLRLGPDGALVGSMDASWSCASDVLFRQGLARESGDEVLRAARERAIGPAIAWTARDERYSLDSLSLSYHGEVELKGLVQKAGDGQTIELGTIRMDDFKIPAGPREYQIHFKHPQRFHSLVELTLPAGSQVDGCPGERRGRTDYASYRTRCSLDQGRVSLEREFILQECFFYPQAADSLHAWFATMYAGSPLILRPAGR